MDKKLLFILVLVLVLVSPGESWGGRRRSGRSRRGGFFRKALGKVKQIGSHALGGLSTMGGHVGRLAGCGMRTFPFARGITSLAGGWLHGDEKVQILKELKDLREKDFDTYHASMLIAADELSKDMDEEEAKQKLQYVDDVLSEDTANKELFELLEEAEVEEATQKNEDEQ